MREHDLGGGRSNRRRRFDDDEPRYLKRRRPEAHADCVRRMDGNFAVAWNADTTLSRLSPTPSETA